ncbi:MAG: hypothetical protein AB7S81_07135 [Bdellovibrionales bacterium]
MRFLAALIVVVCVSFAVDVKASQPEARAVALLYGCSPKKIEVIKTNLGPPSQTVYRAECNMPKMTGTTSANLANTLLIGCTGTLCDLIRATKNK